MRKNARSMHARIGLVCALALLAIVRADAGQAQQPETDAPTAAKEPRVTMHARGTFIVELKPQPEEGGAEAEMLGRMTIAKQFSGDLEASSRGQMLSALTSTSGSAGYVAIERVTGTLDGRSGSFVLQHSGTMTRGAPSLTVTVVPDSATGELSGLAGAMTIEITGGKHLYDLAYSLADPE